MVVVLSSNSCYNLCHGELLTQIGYKGGTAMDAQRSTAPLIPNGEFEKIKGASMKIYAYANRVLSQACDWEEHKGAGFALFDKDACLLKLYGAPEFMALCADHGVRQHTRWDAASWTATAVSRGLEAQTFTAARGEENPPALRDLELFFTPLLLEKPGSTGSFETLGGIALIGPAADPVPEALLICSALANDIVLHMFMANELYDLYFTEPRGMLTLDINVKTGAAHILYHNEQVFHTLGIPYENLYFKKAETFFDPLPKNKKFWEMVKSRRVIDDQTMTISIRGRQDTYVVTSRVYQQSHLQFSGIRLMLTSPRALSTHVAQHVGNNAIYSFSGILGESPVMQRCISQARSIARSDSNVMITGESGTGKDVFAQAIHNASRRRERPFIVLNCAAYPRDLLASELFGYDGGAYTGAKKDGNLGKFELADRGTIFLDEIGDMPLDLQVMLLRVIEQKSFMRIGSNVVRSVDVKIISATNADLKAMIEKRTFRADLYFRLCTLNLRLPPLRERGEDIVLLAEHFVGAITDRLHMDQRKTFSPETRELLLRLPWTGNVRELQNVMERVVQLVPNDIITPQDLTACLDFPAEPQAAPRVESPSPARKRQTVSREELLQALEHCRYNRTLAAAALGISRKTFYRKLEEYGIDL